jgi:subtilisin family serine protease
MTESDDWRSSVVPKVADETDYVVRSFGDAPGGGKEVKVVSSNGGIDHMYAEGEILVREEHVDRVLEILEPDADREQVRNDAARVRQVIDGVVLLALGESQPLALDAIDVIDQQMEPGIATPNHVLTVAGGVIGGCPATEPQEVYYEIEPFPSVHHDGGGDGVLVYMADTGLLRDTATHSWLEGARLANPLDDADPHDPLEGDPPQIPPYTGHGTFVAGVLRCIAPATEIIVQNAFAVAGSELESDLVTRLDAALDLGPDLFHLTIACSSRNDLPLIAFQEWLRKVRQQGAVCIAAAGNSGVDRRIWPAAFPGVIGVGALGGDWRGRATFSNFGSWVDVYAPGRDLINAYATGTYTCHVYPYANEVRKFYGMAKWSGTSFSTPIVTGLIASRMSRSGETARQAAAAVLAEARAQAIPGVGPVLLPPGDRLLAGG